MKGQFSNILCVLHDTHGQDVLVERAMQIASKHNASLTIMLALEALPPNARMIMQSFEYLESDSSLTQSAQSWLDEQIAVWSKQYPAKGIVSTGHRFINIIRQVVSAGHDLVIKLNENDVVSKITGSDDRHLLRKCPCPVWIMHKVRTTSLQNVVAAVDVNYHYPQHEVAIRKQLALDILNTAWRVAEAENASLHVVHVYDAVPENILRQGFISVDEDAVQHDLSKIKLEREEEVNRLLGLIALDHNDKAPTIAEPAVHLVRGYPRRDIAATANACNADLIVMGTLSRLGVPGYIMGGTAEETIEQIDCAVVGLKPDGFVTPVDVDG